MSDALTDDERRTLRFELEHFVCAGQYRAGLVRILESYLGNQGRPEQPAAWISGFFGSGKSHLAKVLRFLWTDYTFPEDGAAAPRSGAAAGRRKRLAQGNFHLGQARRRAARGGGHAWRRRRRQRAARAARHRVQIRRTAREPPASEILSLAQEKRHLRQGPRQRRSARPGVPRRVERPLRQPAHRRRGARRGPALRRQRRRGAQGAARAVSADQGYLHGRFRRRTAGRAGPPPARCPAPSSSWTKCSNTSAKIPAAPTSFRKSSRLAASGSAAGCSLSARGRPPSPARRRCSASKDASRSTWNSPTTTSKR